MLDGFPLVWMQVHVETFQQNQSDHKTSFLYRLMFILIQCRVIQLDTILGDMWVGILSLVTRSPLAHLSISKCNACLILRHALLPLFFLWMWSLDLFCFVSFLETPIFSLVWQMKLLSSFQIVCNKVMSPQSDAICGGMVCLCCNGHCYGPV